MRYVKCIRTFLPKKQGTVFCYWLDLPFLPISKHQSFHCLLWWLLLYQMLRLGPKWRACPWWHPKAKGIVFQPHFFPGSPNFTQFIFGLNECNKLGWSTASFRPLQRWGAGGYVAFNLAVPCVPCSWNAWTCAVQMLPKNALVWQRRQNVWRARTDAECLCAAVEQVGWRRTCGQQRHYIHLYTFQMISFQIGEL